MTLKKLNLLRKYLKKETSIDETPQVYDILTNHEKDEDVQNILREEWEKTSSNNELGVDSFEVWLKIQKRRRNSELPVSSPKWHFQRRNLIVALIFLVATCIAVFMVLYSNKTQLDDQEISFSIKQTGKGEKLNISLPDGSFIKLNSSTLLKIPSNYNTGDERIVYLEGEAFFEVAKYEGKPFKVVSGEITVHVLGTSFNVNTYSIPQSVNVAVVSGEVRVANHNNEIFLNANEMTTLRSDTRELQKHPFDKELVTAWRDNILVFENMSFEEILSKLREWYGIDFKIEGVPPKKGKYSGRYENKALSTVLKGLGFSSDFDFEIVNKTVYINFKQKTYEAL